MYLKLDKIKEYFPASIMYKQFDDKDTIHVLACMGMFFNILSVKNITMVFIL